MWFTFETKRERTIKSALPIYTNKNLISCSQDAADEPLHLHATSPDCA